MNKHYDNYLCREPIRPYIRLMKADGTIEILYWPTDYTFDGCFVTTNTKYDAANIRPVKYEPPKSLWQRFKNIFHLPY